ncbi:MAG TPA: insulinase family protein [Polyangiaceae bacterium]
MKLRAFVTLVAALPVAACASAPPPAPPAVAVAAAPAPATPPAPPERETPDAPCRESAPLLPAPAPFSPPAIVSRRLSNGIPVLFLPRRGAFLRVEVIAETPPGKPGANSLAGSFLELGSREHDRTALDRLARDELLIRDHRVAYGFTMANVTCFLDHAQKAIDLFAEEVRSPAYPADVLARALELRRKKFEGNEASSTVARRTLVRALYGEGVDLFGWLGPKEVAAITRDDVVAAYDANWVPSHVTLVAAGGTSEEELLPMLERAFGSWKATPKRGKPAPKKVAPAPQVPAGPRIVVVDRPGATEAYVITAGGGPRRAAPDWAAAEVMADLFAGNHGIATRTLRDDWHVNWHQGMSVEAFGPAPRVVWWGQLPASRTGDALREVARLMRAMKESDPEASAIQATTTRLSQPVWTQSLDGEVGTLEDLVLQKLPLDEPATAPARYRAVTAADVRRAAASYLDPDRMKTVVVGDWSALRAQMLALGWGPVEVRNETGELLATEAGR